MVKEGRNVNTRSRDERKVDGKNAVLSRSGGDRGFSLVEMVVAISVFAVMMAVVIPHLLGIGVKAQAIACEQNQRMIRAALSEYYLEHHSYPTGDSETKLQALVTDGLLDSVPQDPSGGTYDITDTDPSSVTVDCSVHGSLGDDGK